MKKVIAYLYIWFWYITNQETVTKAVPFLRNIYLENNNANRKFIRRFQGTERYRDVNFVLCKITYFGRNRAGKMITMMSMPSTGQVITARLALPEDHAGIIIQARNVKTKCTGNARVPFTTGEISSLGTLINTYEDTHGAAREVAYKALNAYLKTTFLARIQAASDALTDGTQIVLIQSTGCHVQGVGGSHAQVFDGFNGIATGTIVLTGPAAGHNAFHEWWSSEDGIIWVRLQGTTDANTLVTGLTPGKLMHFRHQIIDGTGGLGMSDPIARMVQ